MQPFTYNLDKKTEKIGDRISALCQAIKERIELNQKQIIVYINYIDEHYPEKIKEILAKKSNEKFEFIKFTQGDLSIAKKSDDNFLEPADPQFNKTRMYNIYTTLVMVFYFHGVDIVSWENNQQEKLTLLFSVNNEPIIPAKRAGQVKLNSFIAQGLTEIHEGEPSKDIEQIIRDTYELRILQSCLYGWENDWERILKDGLQNGMLTKIKFLLAQPYSLTAQMRAHTISTHQEPLGFFNDRAQGIIGQILDLASQYDKDKVNPNSSKNYTIEIKLYYNPSPIPMYQCLNHNQENIKTYFGVFWESVSSRYAPHFEVIENQGDLIHNLNLHFDKLWGRKSFTDSELLDWQQILGTRNNIALSNAESTSKLFSTLRKSFNLRAFSNFHRGKPSWRPFICRYHNRENQLQKFYLEIDVRRQIARIRDTPLGNTYYGWAIRNNRSYSIFVHTCRAKPLNRIIYINFFVGDTELDAVDKVLFGVYNNSDALNFTPYAQVISIWRAKKENSQENRLKDDLPESLLMEFQDFAETIKEKKIDIQHESQLLENIQTKQNDFKFNPHSPKNTVDSIEKNMPRPRRTIEGSYVFRFEQNRDKFYYYLHKETERAEEQIFILGQGPSYFPNGKSKEKEKYLNSHIELVNNIKIHRILLKSRVNTDFKNMLLKVKDNPSTASNYQIYLLTNEIPVLFDLILIDPESPNQTAILIYSKQNIDESDIYPIKMEVLRGKEHLRMISSFFEHCKEYLKMPPERIKVLATPEEINFNLYDGKSKSDLSENLIF